ncbi:MAG: hypothetical protein K6B12_02140 [Clostridiales bacterium]|nr:hypothetical protein [Clostridiales bacterium]
MKKSILLSSIATAVALALSLVVTSCGGSSETQPADNGGQETAGGGQENNGQENGGQDTDDLEDLLMALDGRYVNDEGYGLILDSFLNLYYLRTPSGRIGTGNYDVSSAPDAYTISFNGLTYGLASQDDGTLLLQPLEEPYEENMEVLGELVFSKDDFFYFAFHLEQLEGDWTADGATLTLDVNARIFKFSSSSQVTEGNIIDDQDGRGWYLTWLRYDEQTEEHVIDDVFLVVDDDGRLHLESPDPELSSYVFTQESTEADIQTDNNVAYLQGTVEKMGSWIDEVGNVIHFMPDEERYVLKTVDERIGTGKLTFNDGIHTYVISFNGADFALVLDENDFEVLYFTWIGGDMESEAENLDGIRFTYDMFARVYPESTLPIYGTWTDHKGFTLTIDYPFEGEDIHYEYVSLEGSGSGTLCNDEDGKGYYIPDNGSLGKAFLIFGNIGDSLVDYCLSFETDDPEFSTVLLEELKEEEEEEV